MNTVAILITLFLLPQLASAQEFQYQYQDRPSKEANVVVVFKNLIKTGGSEVRLYRSKLRGIDPQ